jgi:Carbohydrate esterase, sialic acid-specific acetylesterase/Secretion system C-terminal sorting domain
MFLKRHTFKHLYLFLTVFLSTAQFAMAQIEITFPSERAVFQRRNNNTGTISVSGLVQQETDRIEARLVARAANQGTTTDWKILDNEIDGLSFLGTIDGQGGWYNLELRSIKNNQTVYFSSKDRIGIGEVFIISGQSNAQGEGNNPNPLGASDDRVNCYEPNYFNHATALFSQFPQFLDVNRFTKLNAYTNIGPSGYTAWCWGELGDKLVQKLNVPVMFFNTAQTATSSENWVTSINGGDSYHFSTGVKYQQFFPYQTLKRTLNQLIPSYGYRAILWLQGESDYNNSENNYVSNINRLFQEIRNNSGDKTPIVVSRTSRFFGQNFPQIISGQNKIVNTFENIWPGPLTDDIQPIRPDGAHFENNNSVKGLSLLADAWNNNLSPQFFNTFSPYLSKGINEVKFNCFDQNTIEFRSANNFQTYQWSVGGSNSKIQTNNQGDISLRTTDVFGNIIYSNRIIANNVFPRENPIISGEGSNLGCIGKALNLKTSPSKYNVIWSNGATSPNISVSQKGDFFAQYKSNQGCISNRSNNFSVNFIAPPTKPTIELVNSSGFVCEGKTIDIRVNNPNNYEVLWSNGIKQNTVRLSKKESKLTASLLSTPDCPSPESDSIKYGFIATPVTPRLEQSGPFSLKAITADKNLSSYEWYLDNKLYFSKPNSEIPILTSGLYAVKTVRSVEYAPGKLEECKSSQSGLVSPTVFDPKDGMRVYPNPSFDNKFSITSLTNLKDVEIVIFDEIGNMITKINTPNLNLPILIDMTKYKPNGKYLVKVSSGAYYRTIPIIFE